MTRLIVVGAGWSGLAAATFAQQRGWDVTVIEATNRVGGRIRTTRHDGFLVEHGPHAVMDRGAAIKELMRVSQLAFEAAPVKAPRFMVHQGHLEEIPMSPPALLKSRLLSPVAKLRLLAEPFAPCQKSDVAVADLARQRLGRGIEPLMDAFTTGVHAGDPRRLSARHATPALWRMDQNGGILRNLLRQRGTPPRLVAPRDGMEAWTCALAAELDVRLNVRTTSVDDRHVETTNGRFEADRVIVCTDANGMLRDGRATPVAPVTVVALGVDARQGPLEGYGTLASDSTGCHFLGVLYESCLFPDRAPHGKALLRVLVGGRRHPERAQWGAVREIVMAELEMLDIAAGPFHELAVLETAGIPQIELGHPMPPADHVGMGRQAVGLVGLADAAWNMVHG